MDEQRWISIEDKKKFKEIIEEVFDNMQKRFKKMPKLVTNYFSNNSVDTFS